VERERRDEPANAVAIPSELSRSTDTSEVMACALFGNPSSRTILPRDDDIYHSRQRGGESREKEEEMAGGDRALA